MPAGDQRVVGPIAPEAKPQRASAASQPKNPRDFTGRQKQKLENQRDEEAAREAAAQEAEGKRAARVRANTTVDYSEGGMSAPGVPAPTEVHYIPEVDEDAIEVLDPVVTIRVNSVIEDMVFGRSIVSPAIIDPEHPELNREPVLGPLEFYNFEEGVEYKVKRAVALHLDRLGYLYH